MDQQPTANMAEARTTSIREFSEATADEEMKSKQEKKREEERRLQREKSSGKRLFTNILVARKAYPGFHARHIIRQQILFPAIEAV
jgi:hypothetical protein